MKPEDDKSNNKKGLNLTIDPTRFPIIRAAFASILRKADYEALAKKAEKAKGSGSLSKIIDAVEEANLRQTLLQSIDKYGPENPYTKPDV